MYYSVNVGLLEYSRHGSIASRDFPAPALTRLGGTKADEADIDAAFTKYSSGVHSSNGDDDEVPSSPDSDSGGS